MKHLALLLCLATLTGCSLTTKPNESVTDSWSANTWDQIVEIRTWADVTSEDNNILSWENLVYTWSMQINTWDSANWELQPTTNEKTTNQQDDIKWEPYKGIQNQITELSDRYSDKDAVFYDRTTLMQKEDDGCKENYLECIQAYRDTRITSKTDACKKPNGLYDKSYLQVSWGLWKNAVAYWFYKQWSMLYYTVVIAESKTPISESNGAIKSLYQYDCNNNQSTELINNFPTSIDNYFISTAWKDKIIIFALPYETRPSNIPYEGYLQYRKNNKELSRIILFWNYYEYGSPIPWNQITTKQTQDKILKDISTQCNNEYGCLTYYTINNITDSNIDLILTVINENQWTVRKKYSIKY